MLRLLSIIESPMHPNFSTLYRSLGLEEKRVNSMRKAISTLKSYQPDYIVCEFFYGYSNNYAGVNISNLDVMLYSLQKYSPDTRVIIVVDKSERQYVAKLDEILPVHSVFQYPVSEQQMRDALS